LRISLHPVDATSPDALAHWKGILQDALQTHVPVTKSQWALGPGHGVESGKALAA
jgi:hypothetical protein